MSQEVFQCPLCAATHSQVLDRRLDHGQPVINRLCESCGLVFQSPRMSDQELDEFYSVEYRRLYQGQDIPNSKDLNVQEKRAEALLKFAWPELKVITRHLDIGSSSGAALLRFQKAYSCLSVGVEPGEAYRTYAQQKGLQVYPSLDELKAGMASQAQRDRFDLVSLSHVLEHLPDPVTYLAGLARDFVTPGGWLLVEVPNLYGHECFEIAHLVSFSPHTLAQTLQQAGFILHAQRTHGVPRSRILPLYITVLAQVMEPIQVEKPAVVPEKGVRLRRQVGNSQRRLMARLKRGKAWLPAVDHGDRGAPGEGK